MGAGNNDLQLKNEPQMTSHTSLTGEANVSVNEGDLDFSDPALADARDKVKDKNAKENVMWCVVSRLRALLCTENRTNLICSVCLIVLL